MLLQTPASERWILEFKHAHGELVFAVSLSPGIQNPGIGESLKDMHLFFGYLQWRAFMDKKATNSGYQLFG